MSDCALCYESKPVGVCYPCGHNSQCRDCLDQLLKKAKLTCPTCRETIHPPPIVKKPNNNRDTVIKSIKERQFTRVDELMSQGVMHIDLKESLLPEVHNYLHRCGYENRYSDNYYSFIIQKPVIVDNKRENQGNSECLCSCVCIWMIIVCLLGLSFTAVLSINKR